VCCLKVVHNPHFPSSYQFSFASHYNSEVMRSLLLLALSALMFTACVPSRKYEELKAKQDNSVRETERLTNENRTLSTEVEELRADMETIAKRQTSLQEDTAYLGKRYRQMSMKYDELNDLNDELLDKLKQQKKEGSAENRKLLDALRDTQTDLQRREDEVREIEQELQAKERRLNDVEDALKSREARVKELESIIAEQDAAVKALKDRIASALLGFKDKGIAVEQRNGKIYVSLEAQLLFPSGSTVVNSEGKTALIDLAKVIKDEKEITILVEGHTDSDALNGSGVIKDNWDLSVMRATAVVRIMTESGGMEPSMLTAAGRGEYVPVAENDTKEGKAKNRRIEVVLTPNLDQLFQIINE
jgi:chemotaxis protein MotB